MSNKSGGSVKAMAGNDAIASWSGFNYQGKIAILCVLQKLNSTIDLSKYELELEKTEDFTFIDNGVTKELYQVKAVLSQSGVEHYVRNKKNKQKGTSESGILEKLLEHKDDANTKAKCFLVSAVDIDGWDDATRNPFNSKVKLYKYNNSIVGVTQVKACIISELEKYCQSKSLLNDREYIESTYASLCVLLDDCVAEMHKGGRTYSRCISLEKFENVILNQDRDEQRLRDAYIKERIYTYVASSLLQAVENYCHACESHDSCVSSCSVAKLNELFHQLPDVERYIKIVNPDRLEWEDFHCVEESSAEDIISQIVEPVWVADPSGTLRVDKEAIVFDKVLSGQKETVLPTLLDLRCSKTRRIKKIAVQEKLQNIKDNDDVKDSISGKVLLAEMNKADMPEDILDHELISHKWRMKKRDNKVDVYYKNPRIFSLEDAMKEWRKKDE